MTGKKLLQGALLVTLIFLVNPGCFSQEKVLEKSGKTPKWINSTEKDFIIESGKGSTVAEAKNRAIAGVKESILKSVAEQVTAVSEDNVSQTREGNSYKVSGSYTSSIRTKTARMPFFTGISENKVNAFYWEKIKEKKSGNTFYMYHVKYPFSEDELKRIIMDFEMKQKTTELKISEISDAVDNSSSLDELAGYYREIKAMASELEEGNKIQADLVVKKIQGMFHSVSYKETGMTPGLLSYILVYGKKQLRASLNPVIKSNCAGNFKTTITSDTILVAYTYNGCFESQLNKVTVDYQIDDISIKHEFPIDITAGKIEFSVINGFHIGEETGDSAQVTGYKLTSGISSKYAAGFRITKILLEIQGGNPLVFDNLDIPFSGKGVHPLEVAGKTPLKRSFYHTKQGDLVSGSIFFVNTSTGEAGMVKFYNERLSVSF